MRMRKVDRDRRQFSKLLCITLLFHVNWFKAFCFFFFYFKMMWCSHWPNFVWNFVFGCAYFFSVAVFLSVPTNWSLFLFAARTENENRMKAKPKWLKRIDGNEPQRNTLTHIDRAKSEIETKETIAFNLFVQPLSKSSKRNIQCVLYTMRHPT